MRSAKPGIRFSKIEVKDLLKAWIMTSIAFAIFFKSDGGLDVLLMLFVLSAITAGLGFVLHELAHKAVAYRFGVHGEFRSNDSMLWFSILLAIFGIIIAAPGAVYLTGRISKRESGLISAAGPASNVVLALLFLPMALLSPAGSLVGLTGQLGFFVNAILAAFNMIPFGMFDGAKVLRWSKPWYFILLAVGVALMLGAYGVFGAL